MTMPDGCFARMVAEDGAGEPAPLPGARAAGRVEPRSTVGSGDAFLAGFVAARYQEPAGRGGAALRRRLRRRVDPAPRAPA